MNMTAPAETLQALETARDTAREVALAHPNQEKVEAVTAKIVKLKRKGAKVPADLEELARLTEERTKLQTEQHTAVSFAQIKLTSARRAAKAAAEQQAAATFDKSSIVDLEAKRDALTAQRKDLKRQQRAVAVALSAKHEAAATEALLAKLSPSERAALKKSLN